MKWRHIALWMVFIAASPAGAEDWPQWLGPRRDGGTTEKIPVWTGDLKTVWKTKVGEGHSSPVVAEGRVVLHTKVKDKNAERVQAFDAATGEPIWSTDYEHVPFKSLYGNGPRATPTVAGGKVYTFGITGVLSCLDAKTGKIDWQVDTLKEFGAKNLFFGMSCSPLVDGDAVFVNVGGKGASIVAFDKASGKVLWKSLDDPASYSSPILTTVDGTRQLIFLTGVQLVGLDPKTGHKIWGFPFRDAIAESSTTPVRVGDVLFGSSITLGSVGLKLNKDGVDKLWAEKGMTCYFSTPVPVGKDLYVVTGALGPLGKATLRCVDPKTGKEHWQRDRVGKYHASLVRTGDDKLLLLEEKGALVLVDPNSTEYREQSRSPICGKAWAHPAIANGRLLIRDETDLVCVELPK